jgi:hypothetical protein
LKYERLKDHRISLLDIVLPLVSVEMSPILSLCNRSVLSSSLVCFNLHLEASSIKHYVTVGIHSQRCNIG